MLFFSVQWAYSVFLFFPNFPIMNMNYWYHFLIKKKKRSQAHLSIRKGKYHQQAPLVLAANVASGLFKLGPVQGPARPMGILPFQHLQTPVTWLWPNQHLVIRINSAQSAHTPGPSQEKCQPLLREPSTNSSGIRFHLPVWIPQECQAPAVARPRSVHGPRQLKKSSAEFSGNLSICLSLSLTISISPSIS